MFYLKFLLIIVSIFSFSGVNAKEKLYDKLYENAVYDNIKSTYVDGEGIDFSLPSSNISGEDENTNGLGIYLYSSTKDDTYPILYYRGSVQNNFVVFGDFCFQIVRTTETGGIKLLYAGVFKYNKCESSLDDLHIGKVSYGENNNKTYLQYAFYDDEGNIVDSTIKTKVDEWFVTYMLDFLDYIEDSPFCNDLSPGVINAYLIRDRLYSGSNPPNYNCPYEYSYTVSKSNGNGLLKYPVAIINADDLTLAGGKLKTITPELQVNVPYIFINVSYWSMSPYAPNKLMYPNTKNSINDNLITYQAGVRPYLSIKNDAYINSGDGTRDNPYIIDFIDDSEIDYHIDPPKTDIDYIINNDDYLLIINIFILIVSLYLIKKVNYFE